MIKSKTWYWAVCTLLLIVISVDMDLSTNENQKINKTELITVNLLTAISITGLIVVSILRRTKNK